MTTSVRTGPNGTLEAGVARHNLTPPVGVDLTGYIGRPGPSAKVHDDLSVTALVLDDGETRVGIVSLDLLGTDAEQDAALRAKASQVSGIEPGNLLFASSHTHAGPATQLLRRCGTPDDSYLRWAFSQVVSAVEQASKTLKPAELRFFTATSDLAINRRGFVFDRGTQASKTSGVITDPEVSALVVYIDSAAPVLVFNYACHGVVMGSDNVQISADWIGAARSILEDSPVIGMSMFLQGCCGNINPRWRGSFDEVVRAGESVARPVLAAMPQAQRVSGTPVEVAWHSVDLPFLPLPPQEELEQQISYMRGELARKRAEGVPGAQLEVDQAMIWWAEDALKAQKTDGGPTHVTVRLQAVRLGDVTLVALPGEAFCEIGLTIKQMAGPRTMVVGYANGNIGYIPTAEAYAEGGYETDQAYKFYGLSMIGPESERIVLDGVKNLLAELA